MMENFTPVSALAGGALIGLAASLLLVFNGRIAGISGIVNGVASAPRGDKVWRILFLFGLIVGGTVIIYGLPLPFSPRSGYPLPILIGAGLLVGFGTRLGSGCTSGHGVCGVARLSPRSITATLMFVLAGMLATTFLARPLAGG